MQGLLLLLLLFTFRSILRNIETKTRLAALHKDHDEMKGYDMRKVNETDLSSLLSIKNNIRKLNALNYLENNKISLHEKINYIENSGVELNGIYSKKIHKHNITAGGLFKDWAL
jgi:hypothetical protein